MREEIKKDGENLVITIPLVTTRYNPYMDNGDGSYKGEPMENIIALVESELDMGFCYRIDMSYKGKNDQWTDYFYKYHGPRSEFEKLCHEMNIDIVYDIEDGAQWDGGSLPEGDIPLE